ncbi:MAG: site-specific integrase [Planctomycetaceae bacterium]|nr:site-specific integrase [Planctomycetaceae bacterium]
MNRLSPDPPPEQPAATVERIEELIHEVRGHLDRVESVIKSIPKGNLPMPADFSMTVFKRDGRKYYEAQWIDPVSEKKKTKSTKCVTKRDADRFAGKLAAELREGRFKAKNRTTWEQVCDRYETEVLPTLSKRTASKTAVVIKAIDRIIAPNLITSLNVSEISRFQAGLREQGAAEATIKGYLAYLQSILSWAKSQGMIETVPQITMPKRTGTMKGRPITLEEFDRMLSKVRSVVSPEIVPNATAEQRLAHADLCDRITASWEHLMWGLWWSGLRIGEAAILSWSDDRLLSVDMTGRYPALRFQPEGQKANRYEESPVAPEFAAFLAETPAADRHGFVFNPLLKNGRRASLIHALSITITAIGEAAGIKVAEKSTRKRDKDGNPLPAKVKYASAHDLRRSFGFQWSSLVMPATLQQFMRHENVATTMTFSAGRNAEAAADAAYEALARKNGKVTDTSANIGFPADRSQPASVAQSPVNEQLS